MKRRDANYSILKALEHFEPASPDLIEGTCGNIQSLFEPEFTADKNGKYRYHGGAFKNKPFYDAVSSPMLLARLVAGFAGLQICVEGQPGYKVTWTVVLRHKKSGSLVTFYDWKGAASFGSDTFPGDAPASFKKDLGALLKALTDDRFPHPYDGCVVGEVA